MACTSGSQPKQGAPPYHIIDSEETSCNVLGQDSLACAYIKFAPFGDAPKGLADTAELCSSPPFPPPAFETKDFLSNDWQSKALAYAKYEAWYQYCECKPSPPPPSDIPDWGGGQCVGDDYRVDLTGQSTSYYYVDNPETVYYVGTATGKGPIKSITVLKDGSGTEGQHGRRVQVIFADKTVGDIMFLNTYYEQAITYKVNSVKITNLSKGDDNCGNPPNTFPPDEPPPKKPPLPPIIPVPIPIPIPKLPIPGPPGPPGPPGKPADPCIPCKDGLPGRNGQDGLDGKQGERGLQGEAGRDGTDGRDGIDGSNGSDGLDGKDAEVKLVSVQVPFIDCNSYTVVESMRTIQVIEGTESAAIAEHEQAAHIARLQCEQGPPVSAIADWWQVRLKSNIPQLVVVFGPTVNRNYHHICIPHPKDTVKRTESPLPGYGKGSWQGMVICKDNSKFIINCSSDYVAGLMCEFAIAAIDPDFLEDPPRVHISERKGQGVIQDVIYPRVLMYFPTGQKDTIPEWRSALIVT